MARIPWPKVSRKRPDILNGTEVERLLEAVPSLGPCVVLMTAYGTGLRISEACSLRGEDIDGKQGRTSTQRQRGSR